MAGAYTLSIHQVAPSEGRCPMSNHSFVSEKAAHESGPDSSGPKLNAPSVSSNALLPLVPPLTFENATGAVPTISTGAVSDDVVGIVAAWAEELGAAEKWKVCDLASSAFAKTRPGISDSPTNSSPSLMSLSMSAC